MKVSDLDNSTKEDMKKRYESGETQAKIAKFIGCSQPTVGRVLREMGVKMRPKGRQKKIVLKPVKQKGFPGLAGPGGLSEKNKEKLEAFKRKIISGV